MMDASPFHDRLARRTFLATSAALTLSIAPFRSRGVLAQKSNLHPTLLTRGEIEFPAATPVAWGIVREVAEIPANAAFQPLPTGFTVATSLFNDLLVTDEATGSAYRLAFAEAAFVRDGTAQRIESLDQGPVPYLRFTLAGATAAEETAGRRLAFSGPEFTLPAGAFTLSLLRAEMTGGDAVALPPGAGETLVLVEQGEAELEIGEAAPRELLRTVVGSEAAYAIRSVGPAAMLYAARDATHVLIATIT